MAEKTTGISPELLIPPGETVEDVLEDRAMTKDELALSTGFSKSYIDGILCGSKPITENFAKTLERVFAVPASFWMNLQANYDAECAEYESQKKVADAGQLSGPFAKQQLFPA